MASFDKGGGLRTPFYKNVYLRSTEGVKTDSFTFAHGSFPPAYIDGNADQMILQPGTALAKITSGPDSGKVGPFQPGTGAGTAEVQTLTKSGTVSGGTWTASFNGFTTPAINWDAVAADVNAALNALESIIDVGGVVVTGGPLASTAFTVTFNLDANDAQITADATNLTGSTPGITAATGTGGVAGASDGRQTAANIVGLNDTFLPWQLRHRDVEVAAVYEAAAVQAWCYELSAAGLFVPLSNTTATAMQPGGAAGKSVAITWK